MAHFKKITIIVNAKSGQQQATENQISELLAGQEIEWRMVTVEGGNGLVALTEEAVARDCDLVVACGGDGTIAAVAGALANTGVPLGILPCGTANVFAAEAGVPPNLEPAMRLLLAEDAQLRPVDGMTINGEFFLLRAAIGWEAEMTTTAPSEMKRRWGRLAYVWAAWQSRRRLDTNRYTIRMDGSAPQHVSGVMCAICNSSNMGLPNLDLFPQIKIDDGKLDVIVLQKASWPVLLSLVGRALLGMFEQANDVQRRLPALYHGSGQHVSVEARLDQPIIRDGEPLETGFPLEIAVLPSAVQIVVPGSQP